MSNWINQIALPLYAFVASLRITRELANTMRTSYRPTVIVGLGGTGAMVVRFLQVFLRILFGKERSRIFQFLVIDTAPEEVGAGQAARNAGHFLYLPPFDNAEQIRNLDRNPFLAAWWPRNGKDQPYLPDKTAGTGTNRVRVNARHALFHYISDVINRLEAAVTRATQINAQQGFGADSIKFYVVGSSAGGTCSGLFIDIAYLCRLVGLQTKATPFVTGILVMDDIFRPVARARNTQAEFSANTLALLMELNHFFHTRTFDVVYNDLINTSGLSAGIYKPVDVLYLVGMSNARGQTIESLDDLAKMIATEVALEIASPLQNRTSNVLDNVKANERWIAGQPTAFSSFALHALNYPLAQIASWCAANFLAPFSTRVLLQPLRPPSEVEADALAFTQRAEVEQELASQLLDRLSLSANGEPISTPVLYIDQVTGVPEDLLMGSLQRIEEQLQTEIAGAQEVIRANVESIQLRFTQDLAAEVVSILQDAERGLRFLAWLLEAIVKRLIVQNTALVDEQALFQATMDAQAAAWRTHLSELAAALRLATWHPLRSRRIRHRLSQAVAAYNAYLAARLELERRLQAQACYDAFLKEARSLARRAKDSDSGWGQFAITVAAQATAQPAIQRAIDADYSLIRSVVEEEELSAILAKHAPKIESAEQRALLAGRFWSFFAAQQTGWKLTDPEALELSEEHPAMQTYFFLYSLFAEALQSTNLLAELEAKYGGSWAQEIALAYQRTEPFWNVHMGNHGGQIQNNLQFEPSLVGYGGQEGWQETVADTVGEPVNCIETNDPFQMLFLKTAHGLPLFALRSLRTTLRPAYDFLQQQWVAGEHNPIPLHVSREWEQALHSIEPESAASPESTPANGRPASAPALSHLQELPAPPLTVVRAAPAPDEHAGGDGEQRRDGQILS